MAARKSENPQRRIITLRATQKMWEAATAAAHDHNLSLNLFCMDAIERRLEELQEEAETVKYNKEVEKAGDVL